MIRCVQSHDKRCRDIITLHFEWSEKTLDYRGLRFEEVNIEISYNLNWLSLNCALFTRFLKVQKLLVFGELGSQPHYSLSKWFGKCAA